MPNNNLNDTVSSFQADVELVHQFVKGDKTAVVVGADGTYPSLAKIADDNQNALTTLINNSQSVIADAAAAAQAGVAATIADGNAALNLLVQSYQDALDTNAASLVLGQEAISTVLHLAQGVIAKTFHFSSSMEWDVKHNMGTMFYSETITNINGDRVYAPIDNIDNNEFIVKYTEPEAGSITVLFYLNS